MPRTRTVQPVRQRTCKDIYTVKYCGQLNIGSSTITHFTTQIHHTGKIVTVCGNFGLFDFEPKFKFLDDVGMSRRKENVIRKLVAILFFINMTTVSKNAMLSLSGKKSSEVTTYCRSQPTMPQFGTAPLQRAEESNIYLTMFIETRTNRPQERFKK